MADHHEARSETILVVDDAPDILRLIEMMLKTAGYRVITAKNGGEALRVAASEKPDLVLLDIMMPDLSGLEVCQQLRAQPALADAPIIILSALTQPPDRVKGLRAGADDYMTKPPDREELLARVSLHLERARRLREARAQMPKQGKIICLMGAKGGVGTTTVAANVAALLVQQRKTAILLELRPSFGTLALQLKATPSENLSHLLTLDPARIDGRALSAHLYQTPAGLRVLFGPQKVAEFKELTAAHTEAIVRQAALMADYILIDLPHLFSAAHKAAAEPADLFLIILEAEPSCLQAGKLALTQLREWGLVGNRLGTVVANRSGATTALSLPEIRTQMGCEIAGVMPFAGEACLAAVGQGVPLALFRPESIAAGTLRDLVGRLMAETLVGIRT